MMVCTLSLVEVTEQLRYFIIMIYTNEKKRFNLYFLSKLWSYQEAKLLRKGVVHSAEVTRVRFSPMSDYILSCCQDGSIFKWEFPKDLACVSVSIQPACPQGYHATLGQPPVTDGGRSGIPACS
jgi:WD40 repeat protein